MKSEERRVKNQIVKGSVGGTVSEPYHTRGNMLLKKLSICVVRFGDRTSYFGFTKKGCAFLCKNIECTPSCNGEILLFLIILRSYKLVALAVDIDNLNLVVVLKVLAQLSDVNVHRAGVEVVVVNPDCL